MSQSMDIRSVHTIQTAEHSFVEIELAGVGNRIFAGLIDLFLIGVLLLMLVFLTIFVSQLGIGSDVNKLAKEWAYTIYPLASLLISFFTQFFQEWLWNGRTVGKYLLNLRVVRNEGQPIGFWEAFGRNLFRLVDMWTACIGLLPMMLSKREKRFGDFVCSTIVINNQKIIKPVGSQQWHAPIERPEHIDPNLAKISEQMTAEEFHLLRNYLARRPDLFQDCEDILETDFRIYFKNRLNLSGAMVEKPGVLLDLYFGHLDYLMEASESETGRSKSL